MNEITAPVSTQDELKKLLIDGGLRDSYGLQRDDLELGLTVARHQMMRGAHFEALRSYMAMVLLDPTNSEFQLGLANCLAQMGEYNLCLQAASAVIALAPQNPRGYYFSGRACLALGHLAEAEEDLKDAVSFGKKAADATIVQEADGLLRKLEAMKS